MLLRYPIGAALILLSCTGKQESTCAEGYEPVDGVCESTGSATPENTDEPPVETDTTDTADTTTPDETEETGDTEGDTGEHSGTTSSVPPAELSADEVRAQLQSILAYGFPEPLDVLESFEESLAEREPECPYYIGTDCNLPATLVGCTTANGWFYAGPVSHIDESLETSYEADFVGDYTVNGPSGEHGFAAGTLEMKLSWPDDVYIWEFSLAGTFGFSGSDGLAGLVPGFYLWSSGQASDEGWSFEFFGAQSTADVNIYYENLAFDSDVCADTPISGGLNLRGDNAYWYQLTFDDTCSGCGTLTYTDDVSLGEICLDFGDIAAEHAAALATLPGRIPCHRI